jgi:hypothetical protein
MRHATVGSVAVRAMIEGAPVTFELMAEATGRSAKALRARARREGWGEPDRVDPATLDERLLILSDRLVRGLEAISADGEREGKVYDKAGIDALSAMLRMVEKIGEITRGTERAKENQTASDADMASLFKRIDDRIMELAGQLAMQLVEQELLRRTGTLD